MLMKYHVSVYINIYTHTICVCLFVQISRWPPRTTQWNFIDGSRSYEFVATMKKLYSVRACCVLRGRQQQILYTILLCIRHDQ